MVIGLGSNLGDRRVTMAAAFGALEALQDVELLARSSIWQTRPVGGPPQDDFYNAAALVRTSVDPRELLGELLAIEARFGRQRTGRNLPRTLDLDLLWVEGTAVELGDLRIPHPRLHERAFALAPLLEVAPDAADPRTGVPYASILVGLDAAGVKRLP